MDCRVKSVPALTKRLVHADLLPRWGEDALLGSKGRQVTSYALQPVPPGWQYCAGSGCRVKVFYVEKGITA